MRPELVIIDSIEDLNNLTVYLKDKEIVSYDTETTGLTKRDKVIGFSICAEENKAFYIILEEWDKSTQTLLPKPYLLEARNLLLSLQSKQLIMHNAIFDCMITEAYFKISLINNLHTDTMVLAHLLDENRRVGLKELAAIYFGKSSNNEAVEMKASITNNGGQTTKTCYELYKADSHLIAKYGAQDALLTYKLFLKLVLELYEQQLEVFFYEDESMPLLKGPSYELNTTGLAVDNNYRLELEKTLVAECEEAKAFVYKEIDARVKPKYPGTNKKNTFNINAAQQMAWLLFGEYQLEFGTLTKGGKTVCKAMGLRLPYSKGAKSDFIAACNNRKGEIYQPEAIINGIKKAAKRVKDPWAYIACDKKTLVKFSAKYKWIERLLEYKKKDKLLNTYVRGIEQFIHYGVIQPSFLQHGTKTGRYSSRNPNLQNLPRDDKRVKACFIARPGKVFVGADYSQLEPRVFAFYSKDERLMSAFDGTSDFYSVVGIEVYDKHDATPQKEGSKDAFGVKYKQLRDLSKVIALASAYGATPHQLAPTTGKSIEDTAEDIQKYFERFAGVKTMMLEAHELVKKQGYVTNLFGRPRRLPEATKIDKMFGKQDHWDLPYEARKLLNMACNARIQGTGGSLINRASIRYCNNRDKLNLIAPIVCQVHDFLAVECDMSDIETISLLLQDAMENTNQLNGVPLEAKPKSGTKLSQI